MDKMDKELNAIWDRAFLLGVEYGYMQCEKHHNIQAALIHAKEQLKATDEKLEKEEK